MVVPSVNSTEAVHTTMAATPVSSLAHSQLAQPHEMMHSCSNIILNGLVEQLGWMFYYIKPNSSLYMSVDEVPNYEVQVSLSTRISCLLFTLVLNRSLFSILKIIPIFGFLILLEQLIRFFQKKRFSRLSDVILNVGAGLIFVAVRYGWTGVSVSCELSNVLQGDAAGCDHEAVLLPIRQLSHRGPAQALHLNLVSVSALGGVCVLLGASITARNQHLLGQPSVPPQRGRDRCVNYAARYRR